MRGEHYRSRRFCEINQGSSPHARGTRASESGAGDEDGIIPACAGNTFPVARICLHLRDHPRMRGEHLQPDLVEIAEAGSSPHARGTPCRCLVWHPSPGIIPACAGNTKTLMYAFARLRDHPRMRGEHPLETFADRMKLGSSPHARGTLAQFSLLCIVSRDHPRMRGEHLSHENYLRSRGGSSPHARGTLTPETPDGLITGIIPACAGNTMINPLEFSNDGDHPRMRGEHDVIRWRVIDGEGSSPHARGTPHHVDHGAPELGIIPACAGNT